MRQTIKPDLIVLNLPDKFGRTNEEYIIPSQLKRSVFVNRCGRDWGPATKIVPTVLLLREKNYSPDTCVVYLDDDVIYPSHMLSYFLKLPSKDIWTLHGLCAPTYAEMLNIAESTTDVKELNKQFLHLFLAGIWSITRYSSRTVRTGVPCDIVEAYAGICTRLSMYKDDFIPYMEKAMQSDLSKFADDVTLSNYFAKHYIDRRIVYSDDLKWTDLKAMPWGLNDPDALQNGGALNETNLERYIKLVRKLELHDEYYLRLRSNYTCLQD